MRVIAGAFKGRKLIAPKGSAVRPTTDRVKEAIFSMILPELTDAVCLDLFAGTGALGIEALSRGAARVFFCDEASDSIAALKKNLDHCGIDAAHATLFGSDWRVALPMLPEKCNLVFIDAPYRMCEHYSQMLEALAARDALADDARIVIERDSGAGGYSLPDRFEILREKRYGNVGVDLIAYTEAGEQNDRE